MTTRRRNAALRRKLLDENKIVQGYIGFPAKLLVKYVHGDNTEWEVFEDFSKYSMDALDQERES